QDRCAVRLETEYPHAPGVAGHRQDLTRAAEGQRPDGLLDRHVRRPARLWPRQIPEHGLRVTLSGHEESGSVIAERRETARLSVQPDLASSCRNRGEVPFDQRAVVVEGAA